MKNQRNITIIITLLVILASSTLAFIIGAQESDLAYASILAVLIQFGLIGYALTKRTTLSWILVVAFFLRAVVALVNWRFNFIEQRVATSIFDEAGFFILERLKEGHLVTVSEVSGGLPIASYSYFIAGIYLIFGHHLPIVLIANCFIDILAIGYIYRITTHLANRRAGLIVVLVESIAPYTLWMNGTFLRESFVRLLLAAVLYNLIKWVQLKRVNLSVTVLALIIVSLLRPENAPSLILVILIAWLVKNYQSFDRNRIILTAAIGLPVTIGAFILIFSNSEFLFRFDGGFQAEFFEEFRSARDHGSLVYLVNVRYNSFFTIIASLPLRTFYFMFVPFPWMVSTATQALGLIDSFMYLALFIPALPYAIKSVRERNGAAIILLAYFLIGASSFAIVESNVGAALRHRRQFIFIISVFGAAKLGVDGLRFGRMSQKYRSQPISLATSGENNA